MAKKLQTQVIIKAIVGKIMISLCRAFNPMRSLVAFSMNNDLKKNAQLIRFHQFSRSLITRDFGEIKALKNFNSARKWCVQPSLGQTLPIHLGDVNRAVISSSRESHSTDSNSWMYPFSLTCLFLYLVHKNQEKVFAEEADLEEPLQKVCEKGLLRDLKEFMRLYGIEHIISIIDEKDLLHKVTDLKTFTFLAENGANIQKRDTYNWTPFHYAVYRNNLKIVKYLWEKYPDAIHARTGKGWFNGYETLLHIAARYSVYETLSFILEKKIFDIDVRDQRKRTPLHWAVKNGNLDNVRALIRYGFSVNATDRSNQTPLHYAAIYGLLNGAFLLLGESGCEVNARDNKGCTPLHLAVQHRESSMVKCLIEKGGDPEIVNHQGKTAFDSCKEDSPELTQFKKRMQAEISPYLAKKYYQQGNYTSAEKYGKLALEANSKNGLIHQLLGEIYTKRKNYDIAAHHFKAFVSLNENNETGHFKLANTYLALGDWTKGIASYTDVLKLNPNHSTAHYNRGIAYKEKGEFAEAIRDIQVFIDHETDNSKQSKAYVMMGQCYQQLGMYDKAKDCVQKAGNLASDTPYAGFELDLVRASESEAKKISCPAIEQSEMDIIKAFSDARISNCTTQSIENAFRKRSSFNEETFDHYVSYYKPRFMLDHDQRDGNPILIDEMIDHILNFPSFNTVLGRDVRKMTDIREHYQFKYTQHLMGRGEGIVDEKTMREIEEKDRKKISISEIQKGEGFHPINFLPLRIRCLFSLYIRIDKDEISLDQLIKNKANKSQDIVAKERATIKADLLSRIKQEILCDIETFRCRRDLMLICALPKALQERVLNAHIENMKEKILNLKVGENFVYATGHRSHCLYVNFSKEANTNQVIVRIDNLGDGIIDEAKQSFRHRIVETSTGMKVYSYLIKDGSLNLNKYLKDIIMSLFKDKDDPNLWNSIYPVPCQEPSVYIHSLFPKKPQRVGNCVVENHNVGYEIRLGPQFYKWMIHKEIIMAGLLRLDPDQLLP